MTISVILPAYNCEDCVERAIESVLVQDVPGLEFLILDDGSIDGTSRIIRKYRKWARTIRHKNRGLSATRNRGVGMARHDYLAFIDSDDEWLPGKLKHQMELFRRYPEVALTTTGSRFHTKEGRLTRIEQREFHGKMIPQLAKGDYINTSSVMVKRDALRFFKKPFPESIRYAEDYVLWVRLALRHEFHASSEILVETRASSHEDFLRKYDEKDMRIAYGLILKAVEGHCGKREIKRFRSRLHFELASLHARRKELGGMLAEIFTGLSENPWDLSNSSWCVKNLMRYFNFL